MGSQGPCDSIITFCLAQSAPYCLPSKTHDVYHTWLSTTCKSRSSASTCNGPAPLHKGPEAHHLRPTSRQWVDDRTGKSGTFILFLDIITEVMELRSPRDRSCTISLT